VGSVYCKFPVEFNGEILLEIGQHLAKFLDKSTVSCFFTLGYIRRVAKAMKWLTNLSGSKNGPEKVVVVVVVVL